MIIGEFVTKASECIYYADEDPDDSENVKQLRKLCREFLGLPNELITWDSDGMGNFRRVDGGYWVEANSIIQAWEE